MGKKILSGELMWDVRIHNVFGTNHHMEIMVKLLYQIIKLHLDGELTNHYLQEIVTTLIYQMQETEDLMNGVER